MKQGIHPEYKEVVFQDEDAGFAFLTRSTIKTNETIEWEDGKEYPLVKLEISSASHPFFTGKQKLVDTGGRVDKFRKRFGNKTKTPPAAVLLKKKAGVPKGSGEPNREKVGKVTNADLKEIAELKMNDLNANSIEMAIEMIRGTARSMGLEVEK